MTKRNELPVLIISLVVTFITLGGGALFIGERLFSSDGEPGTEEPRARGGTARSSKKDLSEQEIVSLIPQLASPARDSGIEALSNQDYEKAKTELEAALNNKPNDPEARIYLNNAEIGDGEAYEIALIAPTSDIDATQELMRGAAQAQGEINARGGINGTPLKIIIVDDGDDKERVASVAAEIVSDEDILGTIGHFSSGTTLEAIDTYEKGKLTMISPTSTSVEISGAGDYIFRTVPSDRAAATTLARYAMEDLNKQKATVFYNGDNVYSLSFKGEFVQEIVTGEGEIVAEFDIAAPGFNMANAMQTSQAAGADMIMMALTLNPIDAPLQVISLNQGRVPLLGSDSLYSSRILSVGGENALGMTVAVPWHVLNHLENRFVLAANDLWKGASVNWRTVTAYDAAIVLAAGIEADPTREGVARAIAAAGFEEEGATEPVRFLSTGDRSQPSQLVEIEAGSISGFGYDFVPVQ